MIGPDDIEAFAVPLTESQRDDLAALARAAERLEKGVPKGMEAPAQDMHAIIRAGVRGWQLYANAVRDQYQAGLDAMEMHGKRK